MSTVLNNSTASGCPLGITDVVLRDAHQSLLATRLRLEDMLPIAEKLDRVGFWSLETWGGATFDACIRYLGEDPWERLRALKAAMPNTPQQMLLRGQNLLGYRHYADDVVEKFVERAAINGVDIFRIFDALNDPRNMAIAMSAVKAQGKHAQGTLAYTVSPVHDLQYWLDLGRRLEDMGADSLCIKDMAGLLTPYTGYQLVAGLKDCINVPVHMQCHATTGLSTATYLKCIEAGVDNVDTAISSMSMTYGHSATESIVAILRDTGRDTGLDLNLLEEIAAYFRQVRRKYARFEGSLRGVDSRILAAQVPGGMLTNLESQLREQDAADKFDAVLEEIPKVRRDLGYIPLVTPTSQIVGTQAVLNVLSGERYKSLTREVLALLRGEYGNTPAPVDTELQTLALNGEKPVTCRPADLLDAELDTLIKTVRQSVGASLQEGDQGLEDVLTCSLFPQVGMKFIQNRGNADAFESPHDGTLPAAITDTESVYTLSLGGQEYTVTVREGGDITGIVQLDTVAQDADEDVSNSAGVPAPLAGNIVKIMVVTQQKVRAGDPLLVMEAMKMENTVTAPRDGIVSQVLVSSGAAVSAGQPLMLLEAI
ncbi:MAG: oxaloacetate decarboxylase subunit alpha [Porticoccus sp.]|nr:MAG: oxaloacetate decarboxylase subunit alpha [Porticoccus sp.]